MKSLNICLCIIFLLTVGASVGLGDPKWATFEVKMGVSAPANPGQIIPVPVSINRCDQDFGGFDLLLEFDPAILSVDSAEPGTVLTNCGWEYFTWRSDEGSGQVRVVGIASDVSVPGDPTCYIGTGSLATIIFRIDPSVDADRFEPVKFLWVDCGDNAMSNTMGDTLFISDNVFDWDGTVVTGEPNTGGAPLSCLSDAGDHVIAQWIEFTHGGVTIVIPPPSNDCDPNGDGNLWAIEDVIFLINYLFYAGPSPDPYSNGDCNCDGYVNMIDITRFLNYTMRQGEHPCPEVPGY
jgi:hypothetical protein